MMNENLKKLLANLPIDGNVRMRLEKIFDSQCPVFSIDFRGYEHGKRIVIDKEDLPVLLQLCKQIPTLKELTIMGPELDDEDAIFMANTLSQLATLTTLYIEGAQIGYSGISAIAHKLNSLPYLTSLFLHGDKINDQCATEVVKNIFLHQSINALSIHTNTLSQQGLEAISQLITMNKLKQISIKCTNIDDKISQLLGFALAQNDSLQGFSLQANTIANAQLILDGIRINTSIMEIMFNANNFTPTDSTEIEKQINHIKQLHIQTQMITKNMLTELRQQYDLHTHTLDNIFMNKIAHTIQLLPNTIFSPKSPEIDEQKPSTPKLTLFT